MMEPKGVVGASQPQWISVKDRLPKPFQDVLVCTRTGDMHVDYRDNGWFDPDDDWSRYSGVTHWMPLPEPPKEV